MKRLILTIIVGVFVFSSVAVKGQNEPAAFRLGVKLGLSSSSFARDFQSNTNSRIAPTGGIAVEFQPIDLVSVSLDILYMEHGYSNRLLSSTPNIEENLAIYGVDVPLGVNIYPLGKKTSVIPRVFIGHSFGFNLFARADRFTQRGEIGGNPIYSTSWQNVTSRFRLLDFAATAGTGLLIPAEKGAFSLDFSYRIGYFDIMPSVGYTTTNTGFISIGYWF